MIEIVPSEHAREVLRGKREFTDFEKATLIWNSPIASLDEKIESLRELAGRTEDETLKKQIRERLEYEKKAFELFVENDGGNSGVVMPPGIPFDLCDNMSSINPGDFNCVFKIN